MTHIAYKKSFACAIPPETVTEYLDKQDGTIMGRTFLPFTVTQARLRLLPSRGSMSPHHSAKLKKAGSISD
jgi:hypothetical protein